MRAAAFVTGTSCGIGAAPAVALARDRFDVALSDLRADDVGHAVKDVETAGAVAYLGSPRAASITGQTLLMDGGLTAY